jgi:hypothetical protein
MLSTRRPGDMAIGAARCCSLLCSASPGRAREALRRCARHYAVAPVARLFAAHVVCNVVCVLLHDGVKRRATVVAVARL